LRKVILFHRILVFCEVIKHNFYLLNYDASYKNFSFLSYFIFGNLIAEILMEFFFKIKFSGFLSLNYATICINYDLIS
jgi:hypothetical protein